VAQEQAGFLNHVIMSSRKTQSWLLAYLEGWWMPSLPATGHHTAKVGEGTQFSQGQLGSLRQVGHYLMTDCNPDIWRSPISLLGSVTEPLMLDLCLVLITDPSRNTNLIEIGIASQEILKPMGRSFQKIGIPTHLLQPNLLHEDFEPDYKGR